MNAAAPLSPAAAKRLSRLSLWLCLTVVWFAAHVLARLAPSAASRMLTQYARTARLLLVARTLSQTVFRMRQHGRAELRRLTVRCAGGAALRRALRRGSLAERAEAICAALAAPEPWIAYTARRLRRSAPKRALLPTPHPTNACVIADAPSAPVHAVNSS